MTRDTRDQTQIPRHDLGSFSLSSLGAPPQLTRVSSLNEALRRSKSENSSKRLQVSYIARPANYKKLKLWEQQKGKKWEQLSLPEKLRAEKEINSLVV